MTQSTPNTQGASWERDFVKTFETCNNEDDECQYLCDPFAQEKVKDFIRTLLSKERAEGERREWERIMKIVEGIRAKAHNGEDVYGDLVKLLLTLPADSTEGKCCDQCGFSNEPRGYHSACRGCPCHTTNPDSTESL